MLLSKEIQYFREEKTKMKCNIHKEGRKWHVRANGNNTIIYAANTRVACFRWAASNGYKVTEFGHGEK